MRHHHYDDGYDADAEDLPPPLSSRIEQLSRKWAEEEEEQRGRLHRRTATRRRIEDWRDERSLRRQFEDEIDAD